MKKCILASFLVVLLVCSAQAATTLFQDNMEAGPGGWTATGLWHRADATDPCPESHSGDAAWYYGDATCDFNTGATNSGSLTSQTISIPAVAGIAQLSFWYYYETETTGTSWDRRYIRISVDGGVFKDLEQLSGDTMNTWLQKTIDLTAYAGNDVEIQFFFNTIDSVANNFKGWYIDDVLVFAISVPYDFGPAEFNWTDIAVPGNLVLSGYDDYGTYVPIGFNFIFFGNVYTNIAISSNGYLTFDPNITDFSNDDIPNVNDPDDYIAPFWDDLDLRANGKIYATITGTAPNRKFIVQYEDVDFFSAQSNPGLLNFQVILSEADSSITFQYLDMLSVNPTRGRGNSATIGIENPGGTDGLKYSYNAEIITDWMAIKINSTYAGDTDVDGLPDFWELLYDTDPNDGTDPVITDDVDEDGLNWLQEFQYGSNPFDSDTDDDGVSDGDEVDVGTNPAQREPTTVLTFAGPGAEFGTAYFKFDATSEDPQTEGFRVYYGASHGFVIDDYDAHLDINNTTDREGYIDQQWGMQGVPQVYFRICPIKTISGRTFVGSPSNELSTYFAGMKNTGGGDQDDFNQQIDFAGDTDSSCILSTVSEGFSFFK